MDIKEFWDAVLRQDANGIREYFHPDAWVNWHNTNEHFTVEEFIRANREYPGEWDGEGWAWCKILCKRNSTKSRNGAEESVQTAGRIPCQPQVPAGGAVCAPQAA